MIGVVRDLSDIDASVALTIVTIVNGYSVAVQRFTATEPAFSEDLEVVERHRPCQEFVQAAPAPISSRESRQTRAAVCSVSNSWRRRKFG